MIFCFLFPFFSFPFWRFGMCLRVLFSSFMIPLLLFSRFFSFSSFSSFLRCFRFASFPAGSPFLPVIALLSFPISSLLSFSLGVPAFLWCCRMRLPCGCVNIYCFLTPGDVCSDPHVIVVVIKLSALSSICVNVSALNVYIRPGYWPGQHAPLFPALDRRLPLFSFSSLLAPCCPHQFRSSDRSPKVKLNGIFHSSPRFYH